MFRAATCFAPSPSLFDRPYCVLADLRAGGRRDTRDVSLSGAGYHRSAHHPGGPRHDRRVSRSTRGRNFRGLFCRNFPPCLRLRECLLL